MLFVTHLADLHDQDVFSVGGVVVFSKDQEMTALGLVSTREDIVTAAPNWATHLTERNNSATNFKAMCLNGTKIHFT